MMVAWQCEKCGRKLAKAKLPVRCMCDANTKPPRWVHLFQRLSTPQDIGLGATVKRIASKLGGERFKKWADKIGLPCGCTDREIEWNRLYPNPHYRSE